MARTQYTFTFTDAQPGAGVTFSAPIYADATTTTADGPRLILDASNVVSVWSDAEVLTARTVDGNGNEISATATRGAASVSTDDGTAPTDPFGSGGSSALPLPDARSAVAATVALGSLPGSYPGEVGLTFTLAGSVVGSSGDEDDRFATGDSGNALVVPADGWVQVFIRDLEVSSPGAVPRLRMNTAGLFSDQCLHPLEIGADLYRFDGVLWEGFPTAWASDPTTGLYLILVDVGEGVALSGNLYIYVNTLSPAAS